MKLTTFARPRLADCRGLIAVACTLAAAVASACAARPAVAQALMVGADGAIHLDAMEEVQANDPVIIQQQPELMPPGVTSAPMVINSPTVAGGVPWQTAIGGPGAQATPYGACSVPFMSCPPMATAMTQQQPLPIKFSFFGEFLYLHPTGVDVTHARQVSALGFPLGQVASTDLGYEPGVRIGGDLAVSQNSSIAASYTFFESDASSSLSPPTVNGVTGAVESLVLYPGLGIAAADGDVVARSEFDFQLADLEYRTRLRQGERYWINGGAGLRYGQLEQTFSQTGEFLTREIDTQATVDFNGGGVKLAIDGGRNIGARGFSIYGRSSLSPMAGSFRSTYSMVNDDNDTTLVQANWKDKRITTLLDYEVGLAWTGPRNRWRFAAGYTQSFWFNAVTTGEYIDAVQTSNFNGVSDTIMLNGLTARVEHLW